MDVDGRAGSEVSDASSWMGMASSLGISSSSSSSSSLSLLSSSSSSEADASSAMKEGRLDFVGADLRRWAAGCLMAFAVAAGRGGLKVGGLRFEAGLEVVGGMLRSMRLRGRASEILRRECSLFTLYV